MLLLLAGWVLIQAGSAVVLAVDLISPWRCSTCGRDWPVPSLARDCERKHELEAQHG